MAMLNISSKFLLDKVRLFCYNDITTKENEMTISEYIKSLGFTPLAFWGMTTTKCECGGNMTIYQTNKGREFICTVDGAKDSTGKITYRAPGCGKHNKIVSCEIAI